MNASKVRFGEQDLKKLFDDASKVIVAKGKKVAAFDMKKEPPTRTELAGFVLGPTGNLRAPAAKVGRTWLIGYNEDMYGEMFG